VSVGMDVVGVMAAYLLAVLVCSAMSRETSIDRTAHTHNFW